MTSKTGSRDRAFTPSIAPPGEGLSKLPDVKEALARTGLSGHEALELTRDGGPSALARLNELPAPALAGALLELPPDARAELLELSDRVDEIVPLLPEAQLVHTIRHVGLADAGWLMEFASPEQRVAAIDLDCWRNGQLSPSRLFEWLDALIAAGSETLLAAFTEWDPELWVLAMRAMGDFVIAGSDEEDVPGHFMTEDGVVFYAPRSAEDEERLREILTTALAAGGRHYWRLVEGAAFANPRENREMAARWHAGRLNDLGFPDREYAMQAYRPLRPADVSIKNEALEPDGLAEPPAQASWLPEAIQGTTLGRALAELPADLAQERMGYIVAVANTLAVADELPLADPESVQTSLMKALRGIERGLVDLARGRRVRPARLVTEIAPLDLFRIGATADPEIGRTKALADLESEEDQTDWNALVEMFSEIEIEREPLEAD